MDEISGYINYYPAIHDDDSSYPDPITQLLLGLEFYEDEKDFLEDYGDPQISLKELTRTIEAIKEELKDHYGVNVDSADSAEARAKAQEPLIMSSIVRPRYGTIDRRQNVFGGTMEVSIMDAELEPKKLALIRTLQILEKYSDFDHPLKQEDFVKLLESDYGIVLERKAVGRNISLLKEAGFDIASSSKGSYLAERLFDDSELHLLIDSVLASRHIAAKHSLDLIDRLTTLSSRYFRKRVKYVSSIDQWEKSDNKNLFYNIEVIDEAIESGNMVQYEYNKFGPDCKLHKSSFARVSPYQLILKNQRYYLMAFNAYWDHMVYHRLDRITNIAICDRPAIPLKGISGYERGLDFRDLTTAMPYFFSDKPEKITFRAEDWVIDQAVDWFGKDIDVKEVEPAAGEAGQSFYDVTVRSSPGAMVYWALQFADGVEVLSPDSVRERVKAVLEKALKRYR